MLITETTVQNMDYNLSDSDESVDSTVEKRKEQVDEWEKEAGER